MFFFFKKVVNTYKADSTIWNMDYAERQLCLSLRKDRLLFLNPDTFEIETVSFFFTFILQYSQMVRGKKIHEAKKF